MVPLELPFAPVGILAIGIEHPHHMAIQRLHDPDPRQHGVTTASAEQLKLWGFAPAKVGAARSSREATREGGMSGAAVGATNDDPVPAATAG